MKSEKIICIYRIRNLVNGKFYIGSTINWFQRKHGHLVLLRKNKHKNPYLQHSFNKYGESAFEFEIFERFSSMDRETLRDIEWWYINNTYCLAPSGYNLSPHTTMGCEFLKEHKQRISEGLKKKWKDPVYRAKICSKPPSIPSEDGIKRLSEFRKNLWQTPEYRQQMAERVTMEDVAKEAGVSLMSVRRTFDDPERISPILKERVIKAVNTLGYINWNNQTDVACAA